MRPITDTPALVLLLSLALLWPSTLLGAFVLRRERAIPDDVDKHYGLILGATLTLLSLIVGFSFSMAVGRYDLRKNLEEEEANAIGTEYVRAELLPAAAAARVRSLLKSYLEQRIVFYTAREEEVLRRSVARTTELQRELWKAVAEVAAERQTPTIALVALGMNDVLNSQGYTQAAWWNRIPAAAWLLMVAIALSSCLLVGYGVRSVRSERLLLMVVPLVISLSLFLIAEIDSPRTGLIRVTPQNLLSIVDQIQAP
jgi:uncharacterized membrane protein